MAGRNQDEPNGFDIDCSQSNMPTEWRGLEGLGIVTDSMNKSTQKKLLKEHPEELFIDLSAQKLPNGVWVRAPCDVKFTTPRLKIWEKCCVQYHQKLCNDRNIRKPAVKKSLNGGKQLIILKDDEDSVAVTISFYDNRSLVLIQGADFTTWILNHFCHVKSAVVVHEAISLVIIYFTIRQQCT